MDCSIGGQILQTNCFTVPTYADTVTSTVTIRPTTDPERKPIKYARVACIDRMSQYQTVGVHMKIGEDGQYIESGSALYIPLNDINAITPAGTRYGSQVYDAEYGNDIQHSGTATNKIIWEGFDTYSGTRSYEVTSMPFEFPEGMVVLKTADVPTYLEQYIGARPGDRRPRFEQRIIADWLITPTNGRQLDSLQVDSGETPADGAEYVEGTGPTYGGYGSAWDTESGYAEWLTPNQRWGVQNWERKWDEEGDYTWIDYALNLDHQLCSGEGIGV
jgi:hypothetical protein